MNYRKLFRFPESFQRPHHRVKPKMTVKIDRSVSLPRLRDGDATAEFVILAVTVRNYHIQSVDGAALKYSDQNFLAAVSVGQRLGRGKAMEKIRRRCHQAETGQSDATRS